MSHVRRRCGGAFLATTPRTSICLHSRVGTAKSAPPVFRSLGATLIPAAGSIGNRVVDRAVG